MNLKVINSNSKGNCYILENDSSALLIECGVNFKEIKKAIDFNILKIDACIVTHEHGDHSLSVTDIHKAGIPVIASPGSHKIFGLSEQYQVSHGENRPIKNWKISAFKVEHDAAEPLGYIIEHKDCGKVLFVTDTYILRYKFPFAFDHVIIEANYCERLADKWRQTKGNGFVEGRRLKNHMSFQTALKSLESLDLSVCDTIVLIHLSDGLTDAPAFVEQTQGKFGIPTFCAEPNQVISFNK